MGVPLFEYRGQRGQLEAWAKKKGPGRHRAILREKNPISIDGKPTGISGSD